MYALVIGGVGRDIGGRPFAPLSARDSNPGRVTVSLGSVGHNIAHNLRLLGAEVRMLTALGDDAFAGQIVRELGELGISLEGSLTVPGAGTATYLFICDHTGDMELALADMEVYDHITADFLAARHDVIAAASVVAVDTNLPADAVEYLCRTCPVPVFADPVSTAKAVKLKPVLGHIHTMKPNRMEAELLSGVPIHSHSDLERAAKTLLDTGMQRVFISLGGEGVYCADHGGGILLPCLPARQVNTTGCGDAFMAALVWAHLQGLPLREAGLAGLAAAGIAMEGRETINQAMSAAEVIARAGGKGDALPATP